MPRRRERLVLAACVVVAAALRFTRIGHQSFWLDESYTVDLVQRPFGDMLSGVASTESTPPLYYALAWLWEKVFGHGEAGLRSLSALFGTLTVPVAWRAAREWFDSPRAGLIAAALVAVNPFFVWYSQEARSYSLLVLMAALSLLFLGRRAYAWWAITAALALLTHYFSAFLLVPEALWLLWSARERAAWLAVGAVGAVGAALVPLAVHQRDLGHTSFIADLSLRIRLTDLPKKLVTGELGTPTPLIGPLAGLIAVAAIVYALRARPGRVLVAMAAAAALLPLLLAAVGADYLLPRNLIAVYVPVVLVVAAGLAGRIGLVGAGVICAVALVVNIEVMSDVKLQRDDWRGAAKALGRATETRVVIVTPEFAKKPLRLYAGSLPPVPPSGVDVREVDVIVNGRPPKDPAPPAGFTEVSRARTPSYVVVRYQAPTARHFAGVALLQKGPTQ
ncbi:MAG TPA: glycosyltransferase family 39 protein [Thermoleophilaceae bacterium]